MSDIKFRAWHKKEKRYYYNVEHTYDHTCRGIGCFEESFGDVLDSDAYIVEQYTGLKDKNGKEIYEGDIVKGSWLYGKNWQVVKYQNYGFYPFIVTGFDGDSMVRSVDIAVIGNIHENPELLKKEK